MTEEHLPNSVVEMVQVIPAQTIGRPQVETGVVDPTPAAALQSSPTAHTLAAGSVPGPPRHPKPIFTSLYVRDALANEPRLKQTLDHPEHCAITVRCLRDLYARIEPEMSAYCAAHGLDGKFRHVCLAEGKCPFDHLGACYCCKAEAHGDINPLPASMHTVVSRYVKPWTKPFDLSLAGALIAHAKGRGVRDNASKMLMETLGFSLARVANAGLTPDVFISHNWSEIFADFVQTARGIGNDKTAVWVCAFAINQNASIGGELGDSLEDVPFAKALRASERVVIFMDGSAMTLTRVWCVFELHLSQKISKPIYVSLPDNTEAASWTAVRGKLEGLDVRQCQASNEDDLRNILQYIKGSEDLLNRQVHDVVGRICADAATLEGARTGQLDVVRAATNPLCQDAKLRSSFHYAAQSGSVELLGYLLTCGAQLEGLDLDGSMAAHFAATAGSEVALCFLVGAKANINATNHFGETPMHMAAKSGQVDVLAPALALGANLRATTQRTTGPWKTAVSQVLGLSGRDLYVGEPLHLAASCAGHAGTISELVRLRADVNSCPSGLSPLFVAAGCGREAAVRRLFELKATLGPMRTEPYLAPLHVAALSKHTHMVSVLIGLRADVNERLVDGLAVGAHALVWAAATGRVEMMQTLLRSRANPELTIRAGTLNSANALHAAAALGHRDAVLLLLELRCEVDARLTQGPLKGATALTAAGLQGHDDVVELLIDRRADIGAKMQGWFLQGASPLLAAAVSGHADTIHALVGFKADVEAKVTGGIIKGCTPLIAAAFAGRAEATQALVDCGANTEAELEACFPARGATALFAAIIRRHFSDTVRVLVKAKANVEAQLKSCWLPSGANPLYASILFHSSQSTMRALLEVGANVESRVTWVVANARPMHAAALFGNRGAATLLYQHGASRWAPALPLLPPITLLLPLPPILVASFTSCACIIIAIIVMLLGDLAEHFPWIVVGPLLAFLLLLDLPRLRVFARLGRLCLCGR